jgi:hypothetical protein
MKHLLTILFLFFVVDGISQLSSIVVRNDTIFSFNPNTGVYTQLNKWWPSDSVPVRTASGLGTGISYGTTAQYLRGNFSLATFPTTTAAFTNSTNKNFVTDAQLVVIGNTSNTNSGDNASNTQYANDYRAANFVAGTNYLAPNGSAALLTNFPTLNQNTSGTAAGLSADIPESRVTNLVSDLAAKQATLVSGTNIKTVNGNALLGSGDVSIAANVSTFVRVTGSNAATTGQSLVDITGLSQALLANSVYEFEAVLSVSTTAVTTGTGYGVNFSAAGAAVEAQITGASTATATKTLRINALNTAATAFLTGSGQTGGMLIKGIVTTGVNPGNFTVSHRKETSGTSTVFINSYLKVTKIQ